MRKVCKCFAGFLLHKTEPPVYIMRQAPDQA